MKLTEEQKKAVYHNDNLALVSCPGSGKTHTIVAKLLRCIDEVRITTRIVGCITYMNSAVNEIQHRVSMHLGRDYEEQCTVETIHSFCLNNMFLQNYWRIKHFVNGFTILSPDDEIYQDLIRNIIRKHSLNGRAFANFEQISRGINKLPQYITSNARRDYWYFLDSNAYVDFDSIIFYSAQLIEKFPFISSGLSAKYAWLLVDEFQDTSEAQVKILKAIASHNRTTFFIVGDPYQSIMGFAGAKPELMNEFSREVSAKNDACLSGNFRSSDYVVDLANKLLSRKPSMQAVGENKQCSFKPEWRHVSGVFNGLQDYFLPEIEARSFKLGKCAILGPNFFVLRDLARQLREYGIPIIGPGARPYRRSQHLIAPLAEEVCSHLISNKANSIKIIRWRILDLITNCQMKVPPTFFSFNGDVALTKVLRLTNILVQKNPLATSFLEGFAIGVSEIMCEHEFLSESSKDLLISSGKSIVQDIESHNDDLDINNFSVEDLGLLAGGENSLRLLTLHRAKGREFDAVAIINAEDGRIPHYPTDRGSEKEAEARRLFYVGITRAKKLLMIFTDSNDWRDPSRFLHEIFPGGPTT